MPEVSIVIPTYNRRDVLLRALDCLNRQTCSPDTFEVIVVVDGSTDGTTTALESRRTTYRLVILEQSNRGSAAARNHGALTATGSLLLFLDDDILAEQQLVEEHIRIHREFPGGVVVGPTPLSPAGPPSAIAAFKTKIYQTDIDRLSRWGFDAVDAYHFLGANTSVSRELFRKHGGYDETICSEGDDLELGLRLRERGVPFYWNVKAVGYQYYVKSSQTYTEVDRKRRAKHDAELIRKYPRYRLLSPYADLFAGSPFRVAVRRRISRHPDFTLKAAGLLRLMRKLVPAQSLEILEMKATAAAVFWKTYRQEKGDPEQLAPLFQAKVPILMYHLVRDDLPSDDVVISEKKLRRQMEYLRKRHYHPLLLDNWIRWILHGTELPPKPVILTFDDGFLDCYKIAWPLLKSYGFPFHVFLVSDRIGAVNNWDGIRPGELPLMTETHIKEMKEAGVSFQAHSCTHSSFRNLPEDQMRREILECGRRLEAILGSKPEHFAYPYGVFTPDARRQVMEAGYESACTTLQGRNDLKTDLFRLRRISVSGKDSMLDFYFKLRFGRGLFTRTNFKRTVKFLLRRE